MSFMYETHAQKFSKSEEHEKWAFPGREDQNKEFRNRKKKLKGQHWELNLFEQWARNKQLWDLWL